MASYMLFMLVFNPIMITGRIEKRKTNKKVIKIDVLSDILSFMFFND